LGLSGDNRLTRIVIWQTIRVSSGISWPLTLESVICSRLFWIGTAEMFHIVDNLTYTSKDWTTMQRAHEMASAMLRRDTRNHEHADRLARTVMQLFDQGTRDAKLIAMSAVDQEAKISANGPLPDCIAS
jgi:hypothetical protein